MIDVPGYIIHEQIASGGMARIYLATQKIAERKVVIKVLQAEDKELTSRFAREVRLNASLSHPNIITVYDVGEIDNNRLYLAMEYHEDGDLNNMMDEPMDEKQVYKIVWHLASALSLSHSRKIFHRDLKPANVLMRGETDPVLTDFGIAIQHHEQETIGVVDPTRLTQAHQMVGTPAYMSPEQICGEEVDGRSDLYSLGLIIFELLTGERAVKGNTISEKLHNQRTKPLRALPKHLTHWQGILDKMTQKEKEDRYNDVDELIATLKDFGDEYVFASKPKRSGKHIAGLATALVAATGLIFYFLYPTLANMSDQAKLESEIGSGNTQEQQPQITAKRLIDDFYVTIPANQDDCLAGEPFKSGTNVFNSGEWLPNGACFSLEVQWEGDGTLHLMSKENDELRRLYPNNCGNLGYEDGIDPQDKAIHFPINEVGSPWVFQLDDNSGTENIIALVTNRENTTALQRMVLNNMPDICNEANTELPTWTELLQAGSNERILIENRDWFEVFIRHR